MYVQYVFMYVCMYAEKSSFLYFFITEQWWVRTCYDREVLEDVRGVGHTYPKHHPSLRQRGYYRFQQLSNVSANI